MLAIGNLQRGEMQCENLPTYRPRQLGTVLRQPWKIPRTSVDKANELQECVRNVPSHFTPSYLWEQAYLSLGISTCAGCPDRLLRYLSQTLPSGSSPRDKWHAAHLRHRGGPNLCSGPTAPLTEMAARPKKRRKATEEKKEARHLCRSVPRTPTCRCECRLVCKVIRPWTTTPHCRCCYTAS